MTKTTNTGIEWRNRYSNTDEPDKHGRWARICYYNGLQIAWVHRVDYVKLGRCYTVRDFFPSLHHDSPCYLDTICERDKDFETIKYEVEQRFTEFLKIVNGETND